MKQMIMELSPAQITHYPIFIGSNLFEDPEKWLPESWQKKRLVIVTDDNVNKLYATPLVNLLREAKPLVLSFLPGEKSKNYQTKQFIEEQMIQHNCHRDTLILALGGGVVGDIAGFVAATFMRGISYIQIPTTLLGMVDSSVGGKTAINITQGKNLIGAFWHPARVVINLNCLTSLCQTHIINGLIEALKMFMTHSKDNFNYASQRIDNILQKDISILTTLVEEAIKIKVHIVSQDEKESHQRTILNFGHTIGHALEKITDYTLLHGYAVGLGILVEAKISQLLGFLSAEDFQGIQSLFLKLNISGRQLREINFSALIAATKIDKKVQADQVRYVLLKTIGEAYHDVNIFSYPVSDAIVKEALLHISEDDNDRK